MRSLEKLDTFTILLNDDKNNLFDIIRKISLRKQVYFNWVKIDSQTTAVLYNVDKQYIYNLGANRKLRFIWKSGEEFYTVDFANNTKGHILNYLTFEETKKGKIEGDIKYFNLKKKFDSVNKVPLVSSQQLDEKEPYLYEHFCIYIK